jgi:hypothetical protein
MVQIEIKDRQLIIHVKGFDKVLSMRSQISVPLAHVTHVTPRPAFVIAGEDAYFTGTYLPGRLVAGTSDLPEGKGLVFCNVRDPSRAISIELANDRFYRILVEVSNETPEQTVERIDDALRGVLPRAQA